MGGVAVVGCLGAGARVVDLLDDVVLALGPLDKLDAVKRVSGAKPRARACLGLGALCVLRAH